MALISEIFTMTFFQKVPIILLYVIHIVHWGVEVFFLFIELPLKCGSAFFATTMNNSSESGWNIYPPF